MESNTNQSRMDLGRKKNLVDRYRKFVHSEKRELRILTKYNNHRYNRLSEEDRESFDEDFMDFQDMAKVPLRVRGKQLLRLGTQVTTGIGAAVSPLVVERTVTDTIQSMLGVSVNELWAIGLGFLLSMAVVLIQVPRVDRVDTIFWERKKSELLHKYSNPNL